MYSGDGDCEILGLNTGKFFIWEKKAVILDLAGMWAFLLIIIFSRTTGGHI